MTQGLPISALPPYIIKRPKCVTDSGLGWGWQVLGLGKEPRPNGQTARSSREGRCAVSVTFSRLFFSFCPPKRHLPLGGKINGIATNEEAFRNSNLANPGALPAWE